MSRPMRPILATLRIAPGPDQAAALEAFQRLAEGLGAVLTVDPLAGQAPHHRGPPSKVTDPAFTGNVKALRAAGKSIKDIASALGCSTLTVRRALAGDVRLGRTPQRSEDFA